MNGFRIAIVVLTLAGIALGAIPGLRMNRATIAVVGATLFIVTGGLTLDEAYRAIDLNTIPENQSIGGSKAGIPGERSPGLLPFVTRPPRQVLVRMRIMKLS